MDQTSFDRIARLLGGAASRRQGLAAALGGAFGLAAATAATAAPDAALAGRRGGKRRPRLEGPCGDGTRKDNICTRNSDCCTNVCDTGLGKKNVDGKGRCRCMRRGQKCKSDRNCCNTLTCNDNVCGSLVCDVCPSGCAFATVEAAYAAAAPGDVISIGAGTYPTQIIINKNITLEACGDAVPVLTPSRVTQFDSYSVVMTEDTSNSIPYSITLSGLTLTGTGGEKEWLLYAEAAGNITWTIRNCTLSNADIGLHTAGSGHVLENSTFTKCQDGVYFSGFDLSDSLVATGCTFSDNNGEGIGVDFATATLTNCTVTGNKSNGCIVFDGNLTLASTSVTGNSSPVWGGGILIYAGWDGGDAALTFTGSTLVTGNTAPEASGVAVGNLNPNVVTVTGVSTTNVYGNITGDQCETSTDGTTWTPTSCSSL